MDGRFPPEVKVELYQDHGSSSSTSSSWSSMQPRAIQGLNEVGPPPFLNKTFEMVDDMNSNHIVSWSREGQSFVVWDAHAFSTHLLPTYFKHNNFSSFVRQLNTYGFRKIDPDKWEFANEAFLQGQKHLLRSIRRRKAPGIPPHQGLELCVEVDVEIDKLRRDKQVLILELVKLRQQQQNTRAYLQQMELRLQGTEKKQQQMMSFLARAMQNPDFIHQLLHHKEKRKQLEEAVTKKKRRRPVEAAGESSRAIEWKEEEDDGHEIKIEPLEVGSSSCYGCLQLSELEALALEMQGYGKAKTEQEGGGREVTLNYNYDKELDDGFWEELLSQEEAGLLPETDENEEEEEEEEEDDVSFLADRLGFLGSSPPSN